MEEPLRGLPGGPFRTAEVARASGYSVQQIRSLERLGVIPRAPRSSNGYRSYTPLHVHALRAYRGLAGAVGPVAARQMLAELRTGTITEAASAINAVHVRLARERDGDPARPAGVAGDPGRGGHTAGISGFERESDAMTITELAGALSVRPSTLRFWEQEGLVTPERVTSLRARRYGLPAIASGPHRRGSPRQRVTASPRCGRSLAPCTGSTAWRRPGASCDSVSTGSPRGPWRYCERARTWRPSSSAPRVRAPARGRGPR